MITTIDAKQNVHVPDIGIAAVTSFQPDCVLPNEWFESMPRKFVKHTGILQRPVSMEDEVALAIHATENLIRETSCDLRDCAGVVFTSPSFVSMSVARKYMSARDAQNEQLNRAAHRFVKMMRLNPRQIAATNTFCAGYAKAMCIVKNKFNPTLELQRNEFVLVVTASRISRITDYSCRQTAALFGDLSTATIISRTDSEQYPVHFELVDANVSRKATSHPFFDFSLRENVLAPTDNGGQTHEAKRIVYSLDGMGIADTAPRAMASAASEMLEGIGWRPEDIDYIVPHQAGAAIVRLAEMKIRDAGFKAEVINGMASQVGNVSSGSIPYTFSKKWNELNGNILCPIAGVGPPGKSFVVQGCIALKATEIHQMLVEANV
jgi:3-oxoacyl-[acyl-carrier-protein] synthase III